MTEKRFKKRDFKDAPRFIPMEYEGICGGWYLFDTEKLEYLKFSNFYINIHECDIVCDILNSFDYLLKEMKE